MASYNDMQNLTVGDYGYTIKVAYDQGYLSVWNQESKFETFDILQFHFHAPSEHTIDKKHFDLEVHIVHIDPSNGNLAVLGFFFDREEGGDSKNTFIDALDLKHLHGHGNNVSSIPLMTLVKNMTATKSFYQYQGSLTTPKCDEIVTFNLFKEPSHISEEQLEYFTERWANNTAFAKGNGNNREIQPINSRKIYLYESESSLHSGALSIYSQRIVVFVVAVYALLTFY